MYLLIVTVPPLTAIYTLAIYHSSSLQNCINSSVRSSYSAAVFIGFQLLRSCHAHAIAICRMTIKVYSHMNSLNTEQAPLKMIVPVAHVPNMMSPWSHPVLESDRTIFSQSLQLHVFISKLVLPMIVTAIHYLWVRTRPFIYPRSIVPSQSQS